MDLLGYNAALKHLFENKYLFDELSPEIELYRTHIEEIKRMATDAVLLFSPAEPEWRYAPLNAWEIISHLQPAGGLECLMSLLTINNSDFVYNHLPKYLAAFKFTDLKKIFNQYLDEHEEESLPGKTLNIIFETICNIGDKKGSRDKAVKFLTDRLEDWIDNGYEINAMLAKSLVKLRVREKYNFIWELFQEEEIDPDEYDISQFVFDLNNFVIENPESEAEKELIAEIKENLVEDNIATQERTAELDRSFPLIKEFSALETFDSQSILQRGILTTLYNDLDLESFMETIAEMNRLAGNLSLIAVNHEIFKRITTKSEHIDESYYRNTIGGALADLSGKPFGEPFSADVKDLVSSALSAQIFLALTSSKVEAARTDWNFLATLAHWKLRKRLAEDRFYRDFRHYAAPLKKFYDSAVDEGGAMISREILTMLEEIMESEILVNIHELRGEIMGSGDMGLDDDEMEFDGDIFNMRGGNGDSY